MHALVEHAHDGIAILDGNGVLLQRGPSTGRILDHPMDRDAGRMVLDLVHPDDRSRIAAELAELRDRPGGSIRQQARMRHVDGTWRSVEAIATNYVHDPTVSGIVVNYRDVTAQVRAEMALRGNQRVLEMLATGSELPAVLEALCRLQEELIDGARCSILLLDTSGRRLTHGAAPSLPVAYATAIDGVEIGPEVGSCGSAAFLDETVIVEDIATDRRWAAFKDLALPHGLRACWSTPIQEHAGGRVLGTFAVYYDVPRAPTAEEVELVIEARHLAGIAITSHAARSRLMESEERYRLLAEHASDLISRHDPDSAIRYISLSCRRLLGFEPHELVGQRPRDLIHPDDVAAMRTTFASLLASDQPVTDTFRIRRKDGAYLWFESTGRAVRDPATGAVVEVHVVSRDITERHQAEEALRFSEQRFRALVQHGSDIVSVVNADGIITYISPSVERILGYPVEQVVGTSAFDWVAPGQTMVARKRLARRVAQPDAPAVPVIYQVQHRDGTPRYLELLATNLLDDPSVAGVVHYVRDLTERIQTEEALRNSNERFDLLAHATNDTVWDWDMVTNAIWVTETGRAAFGVAPGTAGQNLEWWAERVHPDDRERVTRSLLAVVREGGSSWSDEYRFRRLDGSYAHGLNRGYIIRDAQGTPRRMIGAMQDISARVAAEEALRASERRFRALVQNASDMITILDEDGVIQYQTSAIERVLGYNPEDVIGSTLAALLHPDDLPRLDNAIAMAHTAARLPTAVEVRIRRADGSWRYVEATPSCLLDEPAVRGVVITARDITERRRLEEELSHQAFHDLLTGLPNRALFLDRLRHALARARQREHTIAVVFIDLDGFKLVNDQLGHVAGDTLLTAAGERLRGCLRPEDTLARFGGDEFAVLLEVVSDAAGALGVAGRLVEALGRPFAPNGREVGISGSAGVAISHPYHVQPDELLREADIALYQAKASGKARAVLFDGEMNARATDRLQMEMALQRATERGELRLHYQPEVHLPSGRIAGVEALVRWQHPQHGLLSPSVFIPFAEGSGVIVDIGRWVLQEACRQARVWADDHPGGPPVMMSVNLSPRQLQSVSLVDDIVEIVDATGIDPSLLRLEITESVAMQDTDAIVRTLERLREHGIVVAIDDFGTGYSSLSHLRRLPVDTLKIDQSFIQSLGHDAGAATIVQAITTLAHTLGLSVVAEGIETEDQLARAREAGCDLGQGHYFSRPLSAADIGALLGVAP